MRAPKGWKLVPMEPTDLMLVQMTRALNDRAEKADSYRAMLAAAPKPPSKRPVKGNL